MLLEAKEIKVGNIIKYHNIIYKVTDVTHVKPGKGGAFKQIIAQGLFERKKLENRFRVDELVDKVFITEKKVTYIGKNQDIYTFIDLLDSQDVEINGSFINFSEFLQEEMECIMLIDDNENILGVNLPTSIKVKINSTTLGTGSGEKSATLENGITIKVPQYIQESETVMVSLTDDKPRFKSR